MPLSYRNSRKLINIISNLIFNGNAKASMQLTELAISEGIPLNSLIKDAVFRALNAPKKLHMLETLIMSRAAIGVLNVIIPKLPEESKLKGSVVIGSAYNDLHDIGKNLIAVLLLKAGLNVSDLGVDVLKE